MFSHWFTFVSKLVFRSINRLLDVMDGVVTVHDVSLLLRYLGSHWSRCGVSTLQLMSAIESASFPSDSQPMAAEAAGEGEEEDQSELPPGVKWGHHWASATEWSVVIHIAASLCWGAACILWHWRVWQWHSQKWCCQEVKNYSRKNHLLWTRRKTFWLCRQQKLQCLYVTTWSMAP